MRNFQAMVSKKKEIASGVIDVCSKNVKVLNGMIKENVKVASLLEKDHKEYMLHLCHRKTQFKLQNP